MNPIFAQLPTQPDFSTHVVCNIGAPCGDAGTFTDLVRMFLKFLLPIIPVIMGLAFLAFLWGVVKFISKASDEKGRAEGKKMMLWGVIALFIMVSIFSILSFFYNDIGFGAFGFPKLPTE